MWEREVCRSDPGTVVELKFETAALAAGDRLCSMRGYCIVSEAIIGDSLVHAKSVTVCVRAAES